MSHKKIKSGINDLISAAHGASRAAGWYTNPRSGAPIKRNVGEMIALAHSELSEALEAYRKTRMDDHLPHRLGVEVELADTMIRIADLAGHLGLDLAGAITEKMDYNAKRADHKIENRRLKGGKKF